MVWYKIVFTYDITIGFDYYRNQVKTKNTEIDFTIEVVKDVYLRNTDKGEFVSGLFFPIYKVI